MKSKREADLEQENKRMRQCLEKTVTQVDDMTDEINLLTSKMSAYSRPVVKAIIKLCQKQDAIINRIQRVLASPKGKDGE